MSILFYKSVTCCSLIIISLIVKFLYTCFIQKASYHFFFIFNSEIRVCMRIIQFILNSLYIDKFIFTNIMIHKCYIKDIGNLNFYFQVKSHFLVYGFASVISWIHNTSLINIFLTHYKANFNKKNTIRYR